MDELTDTAPALDRIMGRWDGDGCTFDELDPVRRMIALLAILRCRPLSTDVDLTNAQRSDIDYLANASVSSPVDDSTTRPKTEALRSARVALRPARVSDADLIYDVVNNPDVSLRLPTKGRYVSPAEVYSSLANETSQLTIAFEVETGSPTTVLSLTGLSELNGVAELSFFSLRNSSAPGNATSMEALLCFLSFSFRSRPVRKIVASIPVTQYAYFSAAEGVVFDVEGRLREHLRVGNDYVDLICIAIWADEWMRFEAEIRDAVTRWGN